MYINHFEIKGVSTDIIDSKHVQACIKATIKAVFYDKEWKGNGNLVCGLVALSGPYANDVAFFMSKNFSQLDYTPNIGTETFVNIYPVAQTLNGHKFGSINYIASNLYPPFMKGACTIPNDAKLKEVLEESTDLCVHLMNHYPTMAFPLEFIRYFFFVSANN